jgi:V/A-type H+-transporting ATPase subunit E
MSEHIQPLLERIQSEGLQKAEAERETILDQARNEAEGILQSARNEADDIRQKATAEAAASLQRGQATLEQAARDLLLRLRTEMHRQVQIAAEKAASATLSSEEAVAALLKERIQHQDASTHITVETNPALGEKLKPLLPALLQEAGVAGGEVVMHPKAGAGFELRFSDSTAGVDISAEAVAEWLSSLIRPELAALLKPEAGNTDA